MKTEVEVAELIAEFNKDGRTKTFAEFIAFLFKDQLIEIYLGDEYESVSTEQVSTTYPAIFCGKVIAAYKECLVLSSVYCENKAIKDKALKLGNLVFINERAIRGLNEVDGNGSMEEMFLRSKDTLDILAQFGKKGK
jgi:hypothetical protein